MAPGTESGDSGSLRQPAARLMGSCIAAGGALRDLDYENCCATERIDCIERGKHKNMCAF